MSTSRHLPTASPLPVGLRPPTSRSRRAATAASVAAAKRSGVPSWADRAACSGQTELFFGGSTESDRQREDRERRALMVCATCEVIAPCRDHARRFREAGVWGGESESERRAALKREASTAPGTPALHAAAELAVAPAIEPGAGHEVDAPAGATRLRRVR